MHKSRLIEVFKSLNKKELRELNKFVRSPFFNQRQDVIDLFDYLSNHTPFRRLQKIDREQVFKKIFPKEPYSEKKIGYAMTFLFQTIKSYLTYNEFASEPANSQLYLVRALNKKGISRQFETEWGIANQTLQQHAFRDSNYHFNQYRLHFEKYNFDLRQKRLQTDSFQEYSDELIRYFLSTKLMQMCGVVTNKALSSLDSSKDFRDEILSYVESKDFSDYPAVAVYYYGYKALTEPNSKNNFDELRRLIKKHYKNFPRTELRGIYLLAINYCIKQMSVNRQLFLKEVLELYKEGLTIDVFIENGHLSRFTYNNIVMAGVGLQEFEWIEQFLYEYKELIEPKYQESVFQFNLAILYYQKQDYDKVMDLLNRVEFDDVFYNANARTMLLKIYYELNEIDPLASLLDSFKNYVYRHDELGYLRDAFLNLIKFIKKLLNLDFYDKKAIEGLRIEIAKAKIVSEKAWLLKQLERKR